ncbi:hypothetical protein [Methylocystis parvus]|uniref:hypothetical protein n=1 Tax=Methylocystis parvus TaxID=134 RepID=UPI003C717BE9
MVVADNDTFVDPNAPEKSNPAPVQLEAFDEFHASVEAPALMIVGLTESKAVGDPETVTCTLAVAEPLPVHVTA